MTQNRHYWLCQVLIGVAGDDVAQKRYLIRRLATFRSFPDNLLEDDQEDQFDQVVDELCAKLGVNRKELEDEANRQKALATRIEKEGEPPVQ